MSMQNQGQAHLLLPARLSARFRGPTLPAQRLSFFSTANVRNVSQYCLHNYYISIKGPFFVSVRPVIIVNEVVHKVNINEIKICAMLRFDVANYANLVSIFTLEWNDPIVQGKQFGKCA